MMSGATRTTVNGVSHVTVPEMNFMHGFCNTINGTPSPTEDTRNGINPANCNANPNSPVSTSKDLDEAVNAAQKAFTTWSKTSFEERRSALSTFLDALESNADKFSQLLTIEQGKSVGQSAAEVAMAVRWARGCILIPVSEKILEETDERRLVQRYTPLGVVGAIPPWNFPIMLSILKLVPGIYAGNTVIIKPSPLAPYSALKLVELGSRFFPSGVLQCLSGGDDLGPMITEHPGIQKISFTGSTATGKLVMASCSKSLKRVTLELGGNDPCIVCDDVDIDAIVPKIASIAFLSSSQICMTLKRLYVHDSIYDEFLQKLVAFTTQLKLGDPAAADTFVGPIQNSMQFEKAKVLLKTIKTGNLRVALGGSVPESAGYFVEPTIVDNPPDDSPVVVEEAFAPILPVLRWSDEEEVIRRSNNSLTGLGSSVWSKDLDRASRIARQLQNGTVWINTHFEVSANAPTGGHKESGIGVESGLSGILGFCNSQSLWLMK